MQDSTKTFGDTIKLNKRPSLIVLRRLVKYDPLTGAITAKVDFGRQFKGNVIGGKSSAGLVITFPGRVLNSEGSKQILGHHLAYALTHGEWCEHSMSHKDKNNTNNRWENLIVNKGIKIKLTTTVKTIKTIEKPDLLRCDRSALIDYILLMEGDQGIKEQLEAREETIKNLLDKNEGIAQRNKIQRDTIERMNQNNLNQTAELMEENRRLKRDFNKNSVILQNAHRVLGATICGERYVDGQGFGEI
jgi:hypothetical protein